MSPPKPDPISDPRLPPDPVRALSASRSRWRALFEGMLDTVLTIDAFGTIHEASRSAVGMFGYPHEELIGQNIKVLMPEPYRSEHDGYLAHYRETGETWILGTTRTFEVVRKGGEHITCELSVSRVEMEDAPPFFIGSFRDVSERERTTKALRHSERRFRAIFDQEYQFVGLLDPDGTILEVNSAALRSAGIERSDAIGRPFWKSPWWCTDEDQAQVRSAVHAAAGGEFVRFETEYRSNDEMRTVDFSIKPIFDDDGNVELLLPEGRDVTALKHSARREAALLRSMAEIGESASALVHEIKNPITAINLSLRAVAERLGEDQRTALEDLASRMHKLEQTMTRTLTFARPVELHLGRVDLGDVIDESLRLLAPVIDDASLAIERTIEAGCAPIHGDAMLLERVVVNLVTNAIEAIELDPAHDPKSAPGRIEIGVRPTEDGGVALRVEDDGPGIAASLREDLFKPFSSGKSKGTGLGLALTRKIVIAHGGTIRAERSELGGARFVVELPEHASACRNEA